MLKLEGEKQVGKKSTEKKKNYKKNWKSEKG